MALALGWLNVDAMLDQMTPEQFDEWQEYYTLEPFGEPWRQTALLAAEITNGSQLVADQTAACAGGKPPHRRKLVPEDYLKTEIKVVDNIEAFEQLAAKAWQH